jgi:hypothetical protein
MQAWIRLEDIALNDTEGRSKARRVNGYWLKRLDEYFGVVHGCRIDTSVSDLPRVMRCPGTSNMKTKRKSRFIEANTTVFGGLAEIMCVGTPKEVLEDPPVPEGIEAGLPWQELFHHLTLTAQTYLTQGREEPGRHKVMWHTAKKLRELGVTREESRRALRWANALRGPDNRLPTDQIEHALATAYDSLTEDG